MGNEILVTSIKQLCQKNNISVSQLETALKFSPSLISRWKDKTPSLDKIVDIADYFHVSLDEVVGRYNWSNDEFLNVLIQKTESEILNWHSTLKKPSDYISPIHRDGYGEYIDDDNEDEITYYAEYEDNFIVLYSYFKHNKMLHPIDVVLYIQPGRQTRIIMQQYSTTELMPLYLKILNNLHEETPDEIKAEEFKNAFVLNKSLTNSNNIISGDSINDSDMDAIEKIIGDPAVMKLMEMYSNPEFQELQKTFSNPEVQKTIQVANKLQKYFEKLNK